MNAVFQDVHVMIFIGFGFLMTFLKRYSFGAVGFNFFIASVAIQWGLLAFSFFHSIGKDHSNGYSLPIDLTTLINAEFTAGTVLISFGAALGKTSPSQLLFMTIVEVAFAKVNEWIGLNLLKVFSIP